MLAAADTLTSSSMGAIMAIGIAVANAILLVTFAEQARLGRLAAGSTTPHGPDAPVLMTSAAMIAGIYRWRSRSARAEAARRSGARSSAVSPRPHWPPDHAALEYPRAAVGWGRIVIVGSGRPGACIARRKHDEHSQNNWSIRRSWRALSSCQSGSPRVEARVRQGEKVRRPARRRLRSFGCWSSP